ASLSGGTALGNNTLSHIERAILTGGGGGHPLKASAFNRPGPPGRAGRDAHPHRGGKKRGPVGGRRQRSPPPRGRARTPPGRGGAGDDVRAGGAGDDGAPFAAAGAAETDTVVELAGEGRDRLDFSALTAGDPVTVNLGSDTSLATHANRTVQTAAAGQAANFEDATGGAGDDSLTGNGAGNVLDGGAGNDSLFGGDGIDTLVGGDGANDQLHGGAANDVFFLGLISGPAIAADTHDSVGNLIPDGIDDDESGQIFFLTGFVG